MQNSGLGRTASIIAILCIATTIAASAQTFKTLFSFSNDIHGATPVGTLVQGTDGNLYGATSGGGVGICFNQIGCGTIFRVSAQGILTTFYTFCSQSNCLDGVAPEGGLALSLAGNLYGTTSYGGVDDAGSVFRITPSGKLNTLYNFCSIQDCPDGELPYSSVVQGADGNIYGTTLYGGAHNIFLACGATGCGTIFKISPQGSMTTLHQFCATDCADGQNPYDALIQAADGDFYGTNYYSGNSSSPNCPYGCGVVFKINSAGTLRTVYSFCSQTNCADGQYSTAALVQGTDGNFYGTTSQGGVNGQGIAFRLTPEGVLTTLYSFCSQQKCADGSSPNAGLIQATDGNFYGTTSSGGYGYGTAFQITPAGVLTTIHRFNNTDGNYPYAGLVQRTDGVLYGETEYGGTSGYGTVYRLALGLPPFVEPVPSTGKVGRVITILGNNLAGTTSVTFGGGAPASFQVVSNTYMKATVPTGASSGTIQVTTPRGTFPSNVGFHVLP